MFDNTGFCMLLAWTYVDVELHSGYLLEFFRNI